MIDLEGGLSEAIQHFWATRSDQQERQGGENGLKDAGNRSAVTGGKHADGFISLIGKILAHSGVPDAQIFYQSTRCLPGYFRPAKDWDLVAKVGNDLLAVVEVKSQVGSFGNNFNNRVEEALGNATDFWTAYAKGTFSPSARPWLGYVMMLQDHPKSTTPGRPATSTHYPLRPEFKSVSYAQRYEIFCERLVRERMYDAACFIMSSAEGGVRGEYREPNAELGFKNFAASLAARAAAFALAHDRPPGDIFQKD